MPSSSAKILFGKYEVVDVLGEGWGGEVFKVRSLNASSAYEFYALKTLFTFQGGSTNTEGSIDERTLTRFRREFTILKKLNHSHIVRAYEYLEDDSLVGYTMELVSAPDLADIVQKRALEESEIDRLFSELTDALTALHREGVYHRDLKLENVMFSPSLGVKLADFGLIKNPLEPSLTKSGILVGTAHYFPPEYVQRGAYDERSEIYALGLLLYEVITRKRWLSGMSGHEALRYLVERKYLIEVDLPKEIPERYRATLLKCIERVPEARFPNVAFVRSSLLGMEEMENKDVTPIKRTFWQEIGRNLLFDPICLSLELLFLLLVGLVIWEFS